MIDRAYSPNQSSTIHRTNKNEHPSHWLKTGLTDRAFSLDQPCLKFTQERIQFRLKNFTSLCNVRFYKYFIESSSFLACAINVTNP